MLRVISYIIFQKLRRGVLSTYGKFIFCNHKTINKVWFKNVTAIEIETQKIICFAALTRFEMFRVTYILSSSTLYTHHVYRLSTGDDYYILKYMRIGIYSYIALHECV